MFELLSIMILGLYLRLLVARYAPVGFDTYGHLYFAHEVKLQNAGPFGAIVTRVVGSDGFRQPFLWHWLVGFFPIDGILRHQKCINPGIDAIFAVVFYLVALWINLDRQTALSVALLYLLTPIWFSRISTGPRIVSLTPRLVSELVTNLFFIVTLLPIGIPFWLTVVCGMLLSAFVMLSSKFGLQAMLFLVPLTSIITWNPIPILALALGVAVAIGVTRGDFLKSAGMQAYHLIRYFKMNLKGETTISGRNNLAKLIARPAPREGLRKYVATILYRMISYNSYTSVLIKMPVLLAAFVLYSVSLFYGIDQPPLWVVGPIIAATIVFFLINLPPLLFLGEAERYLNHVAFFIVALTAMLTTKLGLSWVVWLLVTYGLVYWITESFFLHKLLPDSAQVTRKVDDSVISYLNKLHSPVVILAYPYHAVGVWRIMLETKHKVVYTYSASEDFMDTFEKRYAADYPYVKLDKLDEMVSEFGVGFLIISRKDIVSRGLNHWTPSVQWQKLDVGQPIYDVYQRVAHE